MILAYYGDQMPAWGFLVILGALGAFVGLGVLLRWTKERGGSLLILGRFLVGYPLSGTLRTDAGWFRRGTAAVANATGQASGAGRVSKWEHLPIALRGVIRWAAMLLLGGLLWLRSVAPAVVAVLVVLAALAGLALIVRAIVHAIIDRGFFKEYIEPLYLTLGHNVDKELLEIRPRELIQLPKNFSDDGVGVTLTFPLHFDLSDRKLSNRIGEIVASKIPLEDPQFSIRTTGRRPTLHMTAAPSPPRKVTFADALPLIEQAPEHQIFLGMGRRSVPQWFDLEADSPHLMISAGSQAGKSVLARLIVSQGLHRGGVAVILDIKFNSHGWTRGLPNVAYAREVEEIHEYALAIGEELNRRKRESMRIMNDVGEFDWTLLGPRVWIVGEEQNQMLGELDRYWRSIKEKSDPPQSPAIAALNAVDFMGAVLGMNKVAIAQRMSSKASGGGDARENYGFRALARYTKQTWNILAPEIQPMPRKPTVRGRWQLVSADGVHETQVAFPTPQEAREYATSGLVSKLELAASGSVPVITTARHRAASEVTQGDNPRSLVNPRAEGIEAGTTHQGWVPTHKMITQGDNHPAPVIPAQTEPDTVEQAPAEPGPGRHLHLVQQGEPADQAPVRPADQAVTLAEAIERRMLANTPSVNALRMAKKQDPEFPSPVGKRGRELTYSAAALTRWDRNRPRAQRAASE